MRASPELLTEMLVNVHHDESGDLLPQYDAMLVRMRLGMEHFALVNDVTTRARQSWPDCPRVDGLAGLMEARVAGHQHETDPAPFKLTYAHRQQAA